MLKRTVLPLPNAAGGHRLGVNGLAVDSTNSILYSAGRDGCLCTWDLHLDVHNGRPLDYDAKPPTSPATTFKQQIQAHTHWINDIALAQSGRALVSASSDITVKLWRPAAADGQPPQTIGLHSDYVKTLAVPSPTNDWIASGGLDRKICLWDLNGGGQKLAINVGDDEAHSLLSVEKGSVYALAATNSIIASGGPEKTVRVWDAQSGKRITKLVGHTDNIRDILISQDGMTIMTASSDCTVKVWSTTAGRCMYTLTMHDASVWSLFSDEPDLSIFYSSDRNGLVAKTDTRNVVELDEGLSLTLLQEHEGVHKVVASGGYVWAATSRPSINRWRDVSTDDLEVEMTERSLHPHHRSSATTYASKYGSLSSRRETMQSSIEHAPPAPGKRRIPSKHVLRLTNTSFLPFAVIPDPEVVSMHGRSDSQNIEAPGMHAIRTQPDGSIEGQNGLIKHVMLSDRRRVLTLDTAGEVVMWDLLRCVPVRSYGKRHLEDVKAEETVSTTTVPNWCSVDTRTGSLAVVLEEQTCFDAEMYADELQLDPGVVLKEDARINLGKWVLRSLFTKLVDEEIRRDNEFRKTLFAEFERQKLTGSPSASMKIQIPPANISSWRGNTSGPDSSSTLRANTNGASKVPFTPGFGIGVATPAVISPPKTSATLGALSPSVESRTSSDQPSDQNAPRKSGEREDDYFSTLRAPSTDVTSPGGNSVFAATPGEVPDAVAAPTETSGGQEVIKEGLFGKKFLKSMSFSGMKKLGRSQTSENKAVPGEKDENDAHNKESSVDDGLSNNKETLQGLVNRIHHAYEESLRHQVQAQQARENGMPIAAAPIELVTMITPPPPDETPLLLPPPNTTILIQEDRPEAGGVADLFEGRVSNLGEQCDLVERAAPLWLGDLLLKNLLPFKEITKISFILEPWQDKLPPVSGPSSGGEGANRLNANRMLRARKILAYVAERIEPQEQWQPGAMSSAEINMMRPEEYLELWCQDKVRVKFGTCDLKVEDAFADVKQYSSCRRR
jgi:WD repeat-containing protein 48